MNCNKISNYYCWSWTHHHDHGQTLWVLGCLWKSLVRILTYMSMSVNISALSITNNIQIAYVFNHLAGTTCKYSTVQLFLAQQVLVRYCLLCSYVLQVFFVVSCIHIFVLHILFLVYIYSFVLHILSVVLLCVTCFFFFFSYVLHVLFVVQLHFNCIYFSVVLASDWQTVNSVFMRIFWTFKPKNQCLW